MTVRKRSDFVTSLKNLVGLLALAATLTACCLLPV